MRHPIQAFLALVTLGVALIGCSQDPACPDVCESQYQSCVSSGSSPDVCVGERDVCQRMCTSTTVTHSDAGPGR